MGEMPDWYRHLRAARYLGVSPWELAEQPFFWREAALVAESVEQQYEQQERDRNRD